MLTYRNIKSKFEQLSTLRAERIRMIKKEASNLVAHYISSLHLTYPVWTDAFGNKRPYVTVGQFQDDVFFERAVDKMTLTPKYAIVFAISTVIDDSPDGGSAVIVHVSLFFKDDAVWAGVKGCTKEFKLDEGPRKYEEACDQIKTEVLFAIEDPGLK